MAPLSRRERIGLWLSMNENAVGLMLIAGVGLAFGAISLFVMMPVGQPREVPGQIVGTSAFQGKWGNRPLAVVQLAEHGAHTMRLNRTHSCKIGDIVTVIETPKAWGLDRDIRPAGCAI